MNTYTNPNLMEITTFLLTWCFLSLAGHVAGGTSHGTREWHRRATREAANTHWIIIRDDGGRRHLR